MSQRLGPSPLHQAPGSYHGSQSCPSSGYPALSETCYHPSCRSPAVLKDLSLSTPIQVGETQAYTIPQVQHLPITQYAHLGMCPQGIVVPQDKVINTQVYLAVIQLTHLTLMTHDHLMPSPR